MRYSTRAAALLIPVLFPPLLGAQDVPLDWDFEEVWRAGGLHAADWAQFTRRGTVAFDGSGNLFVADRDAHHIVKVGPDGALIATIGREGGGPGEFQSLTTVVVWPDGSFVVNDGRANGLQLFGANGRFERMVRWRPMTGQLELPVISRLMRPGPRPGILYAQGDDARFGRMFGALTELMGSEPEEQPADERMIEALDLAGDVVAGEIVLEAWRPPRESANTEIDLEDPASLMGTVAEAPIFEPWLRWDALPDGAIAYADSSTYTVRIVRDGVVLNTLARPIAPEPVTPAIESSAREELLRLAEEQLSGEDSETPGIDMTALQRELRATMLELFENMPFYTEIPVIAEVRTTPDGLVWVQRQSPVIEDEDGVIDVFDPEGSYVGTFPRGGLRMPAAFGPGGLVAYWEIDDLDIPSIVVYRLPEKLRR